MATYGTFVNATTLKSSELNDFFAPKTTPVVIKQSGTFTLTNDNSTYFVVNKVVFWSFTCTVTSNGTANNPVEVSLPVTASSGSFRAIGYGQYEQVFGGAYRRNLVVIKNSTTTAQFFSDNGTSLTDRFGKNPNFQVLNNDIFRFFAVYEAA